jgi:hypothetical protein
MTNAEITLAQEESKRLWKTCVNRNLSKKWSYATAVTNAKERDSKIRERIAQLEQEENFYEAELLRDGLVYLD